MRKNAKMKKLKSLEAVERERERELYFIGK